MSEEKANELGLKPLVVVKSYASAGIAPEIMWDVDHLSTKKALAKVRLTVKDLDLVGSE